MLEHTLLQLLLLLGATVFTILIFQRLRLPASLGYLLVGVLLGSNTAGPVLPQENIRVMAEFGIVFLLFTIGLSFSFPQIYAQRHTILMLGTGQVALTTVVVGLAAWLIGAPPIAAFVIGAVFAQSSTTIISRQLLEQGEFHSRHGRLATTMSVFQDITAVPFVVVIPVLGVAAAHEIASSLGLALLQAALAFAIVLAAGRYLLRPLFHLVAERRSAELFTLTVLFVSLAAAWATKSLGLSMAFGAFLAGMALGETEFRHQVESTIRPFRDVLLGLFFISIGMLVEPALIPEIWIHALAGAFALLGIKLFLVTLIIKLSGIDAHTALRTGLILAVGGEFGFALVAIGLDSGAITSQPAQVLLNAVLFSMILAPFLIRFNQPIATWLFGTAAIHSTTPEKDLRDLPAKNRHVIICGYGRTGQVVSRFLESEGIDFVALDMDQAIVKEARLAGNAVYYGDSTDPVVLETVGVGNAALMIISHNDKLAAVRTLNHALKLQPDLPLLVRTRDESTVDELRKAGAREVIPDTLESGMAIASHSLLNLGIPPQTITRYLEEQRFSRYPMLRELFRGPLDDFNDPEYADVERLHSILLDENSPAVGKSIGQLQLEKNNVLTSALVREEQRHRYPDRNMVLISGDVLVLLGTPNDLRNAEYGLTGLGQAIHQPQAS